MCMVYMGTRVYVYVLGFPVSSADKESAHNETWAPPLGWEDPLEKG